MRSRAISKQDGGGLSVSHELPLAYEEVSSSAMTRRWPAPAGLGRSAPPVRADPRAALLLLSLLRSPAAIISRCAHHIALDGFGTNLLLFQRIAELYAEAGWCDELPIPFGSLAGGAGPRKRRAAVRLPGGKNAAARAFWRSTSGAAADDDEPHRLA